MKNLRRVEPFLWEVVKLYLLMWLGLLVGLANVAKYNHVMLMMGDQTFLTMGALAVLIQLARMGLARLHQRVETLQQKVSPQG